MPGCPKRVAYDPGLVQRLGPAALPPPSPAARQLGVAAGSPGADRPLACLRPGSRAAGWALRLAVPSFGEGMVALCSPKQVRGVFYIFSLKLLRTKGGICFSAP